MDNRDAPEIVRIAQTIERELCALEDAARAANDIRLHNERSLEMAGQALQDGLRQQEALGGGLQALTLAMGRMAQRQQAAIDRLAARAHEIQAQMHRLSDHMVRFAELGSKAAEATHLLQALPAPYGNGPKREAAVSGPPEELMRVDVLLASVSAQAKQLAASAEQADLSDVAREAGTLRQRVDTARTQLASLSQSRSPHSNN